MGLLESHGRTHHLLLLRVACSRRRLACSSSSAITMAATPHRMLKRASWRSNSCLLNIVTTAEMAGEKHDDRLLYMRPYLGEGGENRTMIVRSPAGGRKITRRWSDGNRPICGHRPEIARSPDGHRQIPRRWPSDNARENWPLAASFGRSPSGRPAVTVRRPLSQFSKLFKVRRIGRRSADVEK